MSKIDIVRWLRAAATSSITDTVAKRRLLEAAQEIESLRGLEQFLRAGEQKDPK